MKLVPRPNPFLSGRPNPVVRKAVRRRSNPLLWGEGSVWRGKYTGPILGAVGAMATAPTIQVGMAIIAPWFVSPVQAVFGTVLGVLGGRPVTSAMAGIHWAIALNTAYVQIRYALTGTLPGQDPVEKRKQLQTIALAAYKPAAVTEGEDLRAVAAAVA